MSEKTHIKGMFYCNPLHLLKTFVLECLMLLLICKSYLFWPFQWHQPSEIFCVWIFMHWQPPLRLTPKLNFQKQGLPGCQNIFFNIIFVSWYSSHFPVSYLSLLYSLFVWILHIKGKSCELYEITIWNVNKFVFAVCTNKLI